jgi:hypothetical protein
MRGQTLRSGVYWQAVLKQKGIKQVGHKIRATCAAENELQMRGQESSSMHGEILVASPLRV